MSGAARHILTLNAGSGSLRVDLFDWQDDTPLAEHTSDWRGDGGQHDYAATVRQLLERIDTSKIAAVGHHVVHGGSYYQRGVRIDADVKRRIRELAPLAPQHNPVALAVIEALEQMLPGVPQVAAFDTAFHHTLPPSAYLSGVPYTWYADWGVRRFGFHGLSHAYCAERAAALLGRPLAQTKIVTCHPRRRRHKTRHRSLAPRWAPPRRSASAPARATRRPRHTWSPRLPAHRRRLLTCKRRQP
jgi:acetate kinase